MRRRFFRPLALTTLERRDTPATGGGFTAAGALGQYFANPDLAGEPAFSRRDVRVDFDWGSHRGPGGSAGTGFSAVAADGFSARWTGQVVPKFTEEYAFTFHYDDGVRFDIRPAGAANWTTLVDQWAGPAGTANVNYSFTAGQTYDVRLEYRELTGAARVQWHWASPSTPTEAVEAFGTSAINAMLPYAQQVFADAMKSARVEWGDATQYNGNPLVPADANGWPTADATKIVWEGRDPQAMAGTYSLRFQGRAEVTMAFNIGTFRAGGTTYGLTLPAGAGYDAATNTTTAEVDVAPFGIAYLTFRQTQRTAASPVNTGVTDVRFLRPTSPGSATPLPADAVYYPGLKDAFQRFTAIRWLTVNFNFTEVNWADRVVPSFPVATYESTQVWEHLVQFSNEIGKDLYICIPINANADYVERLARLIRYGSDGVEPYASEQANPVYPGLNPNLRVYVEWSNEIWNWSFSQAGAGAEASRLAVQNNTPDGQIVNFDGQAPQGDFRRWAALKTVQASDTFRAVWGDAAMGERVRVLYEYQYDNAQETATAALTFLDNYFNNPAYQNPPRPVSHYIWGAGGATYFGSANSRGTQDSILIDNFSGESPAIAAGSQQQQPAGTGYTFNGDAGYYRNADRVDALTGQVLGASVNNFTGAVGYRITVGAQPLTVYELGRWVSAASLQNHTLRVVRAADAVTVAEITVSTAGVAPGQYAFARLYAPVTLAANTSYYVLSGEVAGGAAFHDETTAVTPRPEFTVDFAAGATYGVAWDSTTWTFLNGSTADRAVGPVTFRYATTPVGNLDYPPDAPDGSQAIFVRGTGAVSFNVTISTPGTYAIEFQSAARVNAVNWMTMTFNGQNITPGVYAYATSPDPSSGAWAPGARWAFDSRVYRTYGTAPFTVDTPGTFTVTFTGTGTAEQATFLDAFRVTSLDAIFNAGIPAGGEANGQVTNAGYQQQLNNQARWAQAFGLRVVAYEGGWSLGGDFDAVPLQSFAKYRDQRARQANRDSLDAFARSGGALYVFGTYDLFPADDVFDSASYPLPQGIDDRNQTLPADPINGTHAPAFLRASDIDVSLGAADGTISPGGIMTFNVVIPVAGTYRVTALTGGAGTGRLAIDDAVSLATGPAGTLTGTAWLTAGVHAVMVRASGGPVSVNTVSVARDGTLPAPVIVAATDGDGAASVAWQPVAGATGYRVRWGTTPGDYPFFVEVGNVTAATVTGLTNGTDYFMAVSAVNAAGVGLPSEGRGVTPLADGQIGQLATWELTGYAGNETSAGRTGGSSRVVVGDLTRGPGLIPAADWVLQYYPDRLTSFSNVNNMFGQTLAEAVAMGQYYQFTVSPQTGRALSLEALNVQAMFNRPDMDTVGLGVQVSVDGVHFTTVFDSGDASYPPVTYFIALGGQAALQDVTGPVAVRVFPYGPDPYGATGIGGGTLANDLTVIGSTRERPAVEAVVIDDGTAQQSRVRSLTVTFNQAVTFDAGAFTLTRAGGGSVAPAVSASVVNGRTVAVLTWSGANTFAGSLVDGEWTLTVNAAAVRSAEVPAVTMTADGQMVFHRMFGDSDGDRDVDFADFLAFRDDFGATGVPDSPFDVDGNGAINFTDFLAFRARFGTSVP